MFGFLLKEVFFEHVDLFILEHAFLGSLTKEFDLSCEIVIFIQLLHILHVECGLGGVDVLRPATLLMTHASLSRTHSQRIDEVCRQLSYVVELDEVWVSQHIFGLFWIFNLDGGVVTHCFRLGV